MKESKLQFYLIHVIVGLITLACFLMNGPMRGGLPVDNTLETRMQFIGESSTIWTLSWVVWMFCALGLFTFCSFLAARLKPGIFKVIGLAIVAMGIGPDLIAEVIYAFVVPELIIHQVSLDILRTLEEICVNLTGFLGNGLYNLGGFLLTIIAYREGILRPWVAGWGFIAWTLGLLLSFSVAIGSDMFAMWFTASSMVLSTIWMLIFAHTVLKHD